MLRPNLFTSSRNGNLGKRVSSNEQSFTHLPWEDQELELDLETLLLLASAAQNAVQLIPTRMFSKGGPKESKGNHRLVLNAHTSTTIHML